MILTLRNGYPYPYPVHLPDEAQERLAMEAPQNELVLSGVRHFEWLHTVTVEFVDEKSHDAAREATGWDRWSHLVLEAETSVSAGYEHPAIVVGGMAYCGFILREDG